MYVCVCVGGGGLQISKNIFIYYANITMYKCYCNVWTVKQKWPLMFGLLNKSGP